MSSENMKKVWHSSAMDIDMDDINRLLYRSRMVDDFLANRYFIVADKGLGKTLLLKKKKFDLMGKNESAVFIPFGPGSAVDIPDSFDNLSVSQVESLGNLNITKSFWSLAIQISAIKNYYSKSNLCINEESMEALGSDFRGLVKSNNFNTPCAIFHELIKLIQKNQSNMRRCLHIVDTLYRGIHGPVYIFIDRLDQAMLEETACGKTMWVNMQAGLLEAAWNLFEVNNHVKIFCSIRKEAFDSSVSSVRANMSSHVCILNYDKKELHELVNKLTSVYEGLETIEELVGFNGGDTFVHHYTGRTEKVFDYILRHTVYRPRDLVKIADKLSKRVRPESSDAQKGKILRESTTEAAQEIAVELLKEKTNFLDCVKDKSARESFLSLIPKNTLNQNTLRKICQKFNKKAIGFCSSENCLKKKEDGGCNHPFCELFNIGLFGYVDDESGEQKFNEGGGDERLMIGSAYFVVHPSLWKMLKEKRNDIKALLYVITPGILVGDGYPWALHDEQLSDLVDKVIDGCSDLEAVVRDALMKKLLITIKNASNKGLTLNNGNEMDIALLSNGLMEMITAVRLKNIRIFLSYCSKDKIFAELVEESLSSAGLSVTRDERHLKYMMNIPDFMASLQAHTYVITMVSGNYLKSGNCMYEVGKLLEDTAYKTKTLVIVLKDAETLWRPGAVVKYVEFWGKQKNKFADKCAASTIEAVREVLNKEIEKCDNIIKDLPPFLNFVNNSKCVNFETLRNSGYGDLMNYIL